MHAPRLASLFVFCSSVVGVLVADTTRSPLSLAETLRRAEAFHPSLIAQDHQQRAAEARIEQAGLRPNPTLGLSMENFAGTGALRGVDNLETTLEASQTFERGGKRQARLAVAQQGHAIAEHEFAVRRNERRASAVRAYVETLAAQQRLALAAEQATLARETITAVESRLEAGMGSAAEVARARATLALARAEHARAEATLNASRGALAANWAGESAEVPELTGSLPLPVNLPSLDALLPGLELHPRLALQQAILAGDRAALRLEHAQAVQDVTLGGGVRFFREGSGAALVAGISMPLPFRNQNQGGIRAARELLAGSEHAVRAVELELRTAFASAWRELKTTHALASDLRRDALPSTESAHAIVRGAYEEGQLSLMEVIDAQRALVALRKEILDAETASALALVNVESLTNANFPMTTSLLSQP